MGNPALSARKGTKGLDRHRWWSFSRG